MVKTLKAGDIVWYFHKVPLRYEVLTTNSSLGMRWATLIDGKGYTVSHVIYDRIYRTEMKCLRGVEKRTAKEMVTATREHYRICKLLRLAIERGVK